MKPAAFLSCDHQSDRQLASALKSCLQRFARPLYRLRALRVFLGRGDPDEKSRWRKTTQKALEQSRYFLLFACPGAAASKRIERELDIWLDDDSVDTVLIVLTDGELIWDPAAGDFDWTRTTALPGRLRNKFRNEPLYVDLRWARNEKHLSLNHARFHSAIADVAATLHGKPKDQLTGEDVRQHRRVIRVASAAVFCLLVLTAFTVASAVYAVFQRTTAELRLADSLVDNATAARQTGEWHESMELATAAKKLFIEHDRSSFGADLEIWKSYDYAPPPLVVEDSSGQLMTFSPDREHGLVIQDKTVQLVDLKTMRPLGTYIDSSQEVMSIWFSPGGEHVLVANADHSLDLWDHKSGRVIQTLVGSDDELVWAAIAHDGRFAISITSDSATVLWDLRSGEVIHELAKSEAIVSAAFTPDGEAVLTGSRDGQLALWETRSGNKLSELGKAGVFVLSVAVSSDGQYALSGGELVTLWDLKSGRKLRQFTNIRPPVWVVAFANDDKSVIASMGGREHIVKAWNTHDGSSRFAFTGDSPSLQESVLSPYGVGLLHHDEDHDYFSVRLADLSMLRFQALDTAVMRIDVSSDGRLLSAIDFNGAHGIWDMATGYYLDALPLEDRRLSRAVFFDGGRKIAYGAVDGTFGVVDLASKREILSLQAHDGFVVNNNWEYGVVDLAISPDGQRALTVGMDKTAKLWSIQGGKLLASIDTRGIPLNTSFVNHGTAGLIATEGALNLWNFDTDTVSDLVDPDISGLALAVSRDGKYACTAGMFTVQHWDLEQRLMLRSHAGHSRVVSSCDYSPDGKWLVSTSYDGSLRFWETATGRQLQGIEVDDSLMSARFSPDGRHLTVARSNGQLQIWRLDRPDQYEYYAPKVAQAVATLSEDPGHLASLELLAHWYAFRAVWTWSAELFEEVRSAGGEFPSLPLARAYWSLGRYEDALQEFQRAMERQEAPAHYLRMCQRAIEAYETPDEK